jgi:hypothetical protein
MVAVAGKSKATIAFTCVTSTSASSKRLGQRHRAGLVERSKPDFTRALTRDLRHTYHMLETYKLHSRPSAALESSSAANTPSIRTRTTAERRRRDGQTNLLRSRSALDGLPRRLPRKLPSRCSGPDLLLPKWRHLPER